MGSIAKIDKTLLPELRNLIEQARQQVAQTANSTVTTLYWHVGARIRCEVLNETRAGYGEQIVATVSRQLVIDYGQGFAEKSVQRMIHFPDGSALWVLERYNDFVAVRKALIKEKFAYMLRKDEEVTA